MNFKKLYLQNSTRTDLLMMGNPYGYYLNILNPIIQPKYDAFRKKLKIPHGFPLSDNERRDFERQAARELIRDGILTYEE